MQQLCITSAAFALVVGCSRATLPEAVGTEGGECYGNQTCNPGLKCGPAGICYLDSEDACAQVTCSGHGSCVVEEGVPTCLCEPGFYAQGVACVSGCDGRTHATQLCDSGDLYWHDSCGTREEVAEDCCNAGCAGSACNPPISQHSSVCHEGDRWWLDSCGELESIREDCQGNGCTSDVCDVGIPGMVPISDYPGGAFWIDQFEASVDGAGVWGSQDQDQDDDGKIADCATAAAHAESHGFACDDDGGEEATVLTTKAAQSRQYVMPVNQSYYQAAAACANAGKRLCLSGEWQWACRGGTANNPYPYGSTYDGGDDWGLDCWTNGLENTQQTGTAQNCVTPTFIYDLSGNKGEWTDYSRVDRALSVGGTRSGGETTSTCTHSVGVEPDTSGLNNIGFRCCLSE